MNKQVYLLGFFVLTLLIIIAPTSAFPDDSIYVQSVSTSPQIDGKIDANEWQTEEETFKEVLDGLSYTEGSQTSIEIEVVILKNDTTIFFLVKLLTPISDGNGNISMGIAVADNPIQGMSSVKDRKIAFYNGSETRLHDLHKQGGSARGIYPGEDDTTVDFDASYGKDGDVQFFEFSMPLAPANLTEDSEITENTYVAFVVNPYADIWQGQNGHSGKSSGKLQLSFSPRAFFQRPPPGMEVRTMVFIGFMALLVGGTALLFILTGRNESLAKKTWVINPTEKMAQQSLLQEIAYYNSSFLAMMMTVFLIMYSTIAFVYGIWAQWGNIGLAFTLPPLLLSIYALYDLGNRNENLQLKPKGERTKPGVEMGKSPSLWVIPTGFLALVLTMLVFIGLDVIT